MGEWWTWYPPIRTTGGEAAISGERGQRPLGQSAEREKWTPWERIRTLPGLDVEFPVFTEEPFLYQEIGPKALELHALGMNYCQIAEQLQVTDKTVAKGIQHVRRLRNASRPKSNKHRRPRRSKSDPRLPFPFDDD